MIKNWKSLFVKQEEQTPGTNSVDSPSFPISDQTSLSGAASLKVEDVTITPDVKEVMEIYEKGLDSINMPGYDFFEFYRAVSVAGHNNEQAYNMAYQMARTMDTTVSVQKLVNDAEFYISKINEVHSQYVTQGQQKLNQLKERKSSEKNELGKSLDQATMRVAQLRTELQQLETEIKSKRESLAQIDSKYLPQEQVIRDKMDANDIARNNSTSKLTLVRDHIQKFIKNI